MTNQVLFSCLFPSFHGFALLSGATVENDRRKVNTEVELDFQIAYS
jgi:hypothetical protein